MHHAELATDRGLISTAGIRKSGLIAAIEQIQDWKDSRQEVSHWPTADAWQQPSPNGARPGSTTSSFGCWPTDTVGDTRLRQDEPMFLTTAEATWIGVGIGGVFSGFNAWLVLIATRRKDHQQRLWDRTTDLYEHVLVEAGSWAASRDKLMRTYRLSGPDREIPTLDEAERQRTLIRLEMFGHRDVRDAFERSADAHWRWAGRAQALQDRFDRNDEVVKFQIPEELTSSDDITRLRNERNTANQVADQQHDELRRAIQGAVRRVPKPDRWFRRAPRAVGRRIRDIRRHRTAAPDERQRRQQLRER